MQFRLRLRVLHPFPVVVNTHLPLIMKYGMFVIRGWGVCLVRGKESNEDLSGPCCHGGDLGS